MEFQGRITAVLPARTGTRQDGSEWIDLSFIFAYYENGEQRFEDTALVSTFDTNIITQIVPYLVKGNDGKAIVENDVVKMNVNHIPCRCGFSLRAKTIAKKDGSGTMRIQECRCYRFEILDIQQQQAAPQPQPQVQVPFPPQNQGGEKDDLPF